MIPPAVVKALRAVIAPEVAALAGRRHRDRQHGR
jgi:hypothetical protein